MSRLPKYLGVVSAVALLGMAGTAGAAALTAIAPGPTITGKATLGAVLANDASGVATLDRVCTNTMGLSCADIATSDTLESNETAAGDFDRDGYVDFILATRAGGSSADLVCLNNQSGGFTCGPFNTGGNARGLAVGDLDGDGDLDVFMVNGPANSASMRLCLNSGSATFTCSSANLDTNVATPNSAALGDLDNDGDLDVVIANNLAGGLGGEEVICLNSGSAGFSCASFGANDASLAVALGDLDNDGSLDIVVVGSGATGDKTCLNNGSAVFSCSTFNTNDATGGVAVGDLDSDGDLDIALANTATGAAQRDKICLNDGSAVFSCASFNTNDVSRGVAIGDLDGDSDLDIVLATGSTTTSDRFCLNSGTGGFASCASFNAIMDNSFGVALGNFSPSAEARITGTPGAVTASIVSRTVDATPLPGAPAGVVHIVIQLCNPTPSVYTSLVTRVVQISRGYSLRDSSMVLSAPEARSGGVGAETAFPDLDSVATAPLNCDTATYTFNRPPYVGAFTFSFHLFGDTGGGPDQGLVPGNAAPIEISIPADDASSPSETLVPVGGRPSNSR